MYDTKAAISSVNVSILNVSKEYISSKGMIEFKGKLLGILGVSLMRTLSHT